MISCHFLTVCEDIPNLSYYLSLHFPNYVASLQVNTLCFGNAGLYNVSTIDLQHLYPFKAYKKRQKFDQSHNERFKQPGFSAEQ